MANQYDERHGSDESTIAITPTCSDVERHSLTLGTPAVLCNIQRHPIPAQKIVGNVTARPQTTEAKW
jgi:hypothetical protein